MSDAFKFIAFAKRHVYNDALSEEERASLLLNHPYATALRSSGWRTIDSAPKDGTSILLYFPAGEPFQHVCCWLPVSNVWACTQVEEVTHFFTPDRPTHWMPLPQPPASTEG